MRPTGEVSEPGGLDQLVDRARAGEPRAVARLLTIVENAGPATAGRLQAAILASGAVVGRAHVVGLTGSPGVGKSTTTSALVALLRGQGLRVGVLAFDPSSPFTGGAVLGDRVRMQEHATDRGVYIRSIASRGHLGGLSAAAPQALRVLDLAGCQVVLVETVGVGQSEVEVAGLCDTTVVVLAPGMGDGVQAAKAGILEIGDVFAVNKADRDGAQALVRELWTMIGMSLGLVPGSGPARPEVWRPPVIKTVASAGEGIDELWDGIRRHREAQQASGAWERRRSDRVRSELLALAVGTVRHRLAADADGRLAQVADRVRAGELDPYRAVAEVLADR